MSPAVTHRLPPVHTQRNEASPWDGCWAFALAAGVDAATGGEILLTEAAVRRASANPDRPRRSDGGNIDDQLKALKKLAPKVKFQAFPTEKELRDHLARGRGAVVSGYASDMPLAHYKYDPDFYRLPRLQTGHGIYFQGTGDGVTTYALDPLIPAGIKPPAYPISAATRFAWGSVNRAVAILVWPVLLNEAPHPPADRVRVKGSWWDYSITGTKAEGYEIGRDSRDTAGFTAELEPSRIAISWGGRDRVFAKVAELAYIGSWVDLTGAPNVVHLPA